MVDTNDRPLPPNPYVGPRSFVDGEELHGRDRELTELSDIVLAQRIVLLYSPSGAGKSSLLEAALRPRLRQFEFDVPTTIRVGHEPPPTFDDLEVRNRYVLSALLSLEQSGSGGPEISAEELGTMTFGDYLARLEAERAHDPTQPGELCLFFDQFEEIFTLDPTDGDAKHAFFEEVGAALRDRSRWALFAMREDFIAQLDPYVSLIPTRLTSRYRLDLLGVDAARRAVRNPAERLGVTFDPEAADHLIDDLRRVNVQRGGEVVVERGPYIEPVQLQVVCRRLWGTLA